MKKAYLALLVGPAVLFGIGFALNALVCAVNGASMPVLIPPGMWELAGGSCPIDPNDWIHHCMTAKTHLKFLADVIAINHIGIASIGDLFEWASEATQVPCFIAAATLAIKELLFDKKQ